MDIKLFADVMPAISTVFPISIETKLKKHLLFANDLRFSCVCPAVDNEFRRNYFEIMVK